MTTIVVEDGSIVSNANSYVSEAELTAYALARAYTLIADEDDLIIQAMDYIESLDFIGTKRTRDQGLQWPRVDAWIDGYWVDANSIPNDLKKAQLAICVAIDQGNGPLQVLPRSTKSEKVGPLEVVYSDNASSVAIDRTISAYLKKLVRGGNGGYQFIVGKA